MGYEDPLNSPGLIKAGSGMLLLAACSWRPGPQPAPALRASPGAPGQPMPLPSLQHLLLEAGGASFHRWLSWT